MATEAMLAAGSKIYRGDTDGDYDVQTWTHVKECKTIQPPSLKQDFVDVTVLESEDDEFIPGQKRKGNCVLQQNYVPSSPTQNATTGFVYDRNNAIRRRYKILLPDAAGTFMTFLGYVEEVSPEAQMGNALMNSVSIKPTGPVLWGNAANPVPA